MREICRGARKRLSDYRKSAYEQFENHIIHNTVAEKVQEDEELRQLVDVVEQAHQINENKLQRDEVRSTAFGAAEDLNDHADELKNDAIAKACADVVQYASDWLEDGIYEREELQASVDEARQWLRDHDEVVDRLDLDVDLGAEATIGGN